MEGKLHCSMLLYAFLAWISATYTNFYGSRFLDLFMAGDLCAGISRKYASKFLASENRRTMLDISRIIQPGKFAHVFWCYWLLLFILRAKTGECWDKYFTLTNRFALAELQGVKNRNQPLINFFIFFRTCSLFIVFATWRKHPYQDCFTTGFQAHALTTLTKAPSVFVCFEMVRNTIPNDTKRMSKRCISRQFQAYR